MFSVQIQKWIIEKKKKKKEKKKKNDIQNKKKNVPHKVSTRDNLLFIYQKLFTRIQLKIFCFFNRKMMYLFSFLYFFYLPFFSLLTIFYYFFRACESCSWLFSSDIWLSDTSGLKSIHCVQSGMCPILVVFRHLEMVSVSRGQEKFFGISHFCCGWQNLVLVWPRKKKEKIIVIGSITLWIAHVINTEKKITLKINNKLFCIHYTINTINFLLA